MRSATLDLLHLLEPVKPEMQLVDEWLTTNLIDDSAFVADLLSQVFAASTLR